MNIRRALLAAPAAALLALPATAAADPIVECSPTFLLGPIKCKVENTQRELAEDPPVVDCSVTFVLGPVQCRVEREISALLDPDA
jgi:hypothetical protein